jgi:hypothetical protein
VRSAQAEVAWAKIGNALNRYAAAKAAIARSTELRELEEAKDARAVAIKDALRAGMSLREIGSLMGISHTRVREIANSV